MRALAVALLLGASSCVSVYHSQHEPSVAGVPLLEKKAEPHKRQYLSDRGKPKHRKTYKFRKRGWKNRRRLIDSPGGLRRRRAGA